MSRSFYTKHKNQKQKGVIKSHATTRKTSTPNKTSVAFRSDISLSEIDSATSSSSENKTTWLKTSETFVRNQQKNLKKKKRVHFLSQSMKSSTILEESEWETVEEESDKSLTNLQESSLKNHDNTKNENIQLFEDLPIPEITREEPIAFESLSESPIITGLRRQSKKLYLEKDIHDDLLPINLPLMEERDHLKEMDEDEIFLFRESNVKTYLTAKEVRKKHGKLWCEIVENNGWGPINTFLASTPPPPQRPFTERNTHPEFSAVQNLKRKVSKQLFESKDESDEDPIPPGSTRVQGSLDRKTYEQKGRWTRTYKYVPKIVKRKKTNKRKVEEESDSQSDADIYSKRDKVDIEFETAGPHGKRMTLAQFRHRQKMMNYPSASSSVEENEMV